MRSIGRGVQFDIVSMPRTNKGGNWTISLRSVAPDALWEERAYSGFCAAAIRNL